MGTMTAEPALKVKELTVEKLQETTNKVRYSDAELKEFKELILNKLEDAKKDYELLKITLSLKDDHGTNDTSPSFKYFEDAADVLSKEETMQLAVRQEKFIQHLYNALIRVENKSYGICKVTGNLIPKERLRSVPHATMCINAKMATLVNIN
jgi:DnaK suppressor protein